MRTFGRAMLLVAACLGTVSGCVQSGSRPSIWPNFGAGSASKPSATSLSSTAQSVKGQFASMGTVVTSAYGKAKTTLTSAFTTKPQTDENGDPIALNSTPASVGPEIYVAQGQLYESTGQYPKALDSYSKALEIEPKNLGALTSLARLNVRQDNLPKAVEFFQMALEVNSGDAALHSELGDCQKKIGQLALAKEEYLKSINLKPKERAYRANLAGVLLDEGRDDEALQELSQVDAPAMANYEMAYLYFSRQKVPQAQQHLQAALNIDPNLQPARDLLGQLGGLQTAQQAYGIYQNAGNVLQAVRGLTTVPPSGSSPGTAFTAPDNGGNLAAPPPSLGTPTLR